MKKLALAKKFGSDSRYSENQLRGLKSSVERQHRDMLKRIESYNSTPKHCHNSSCSNSLPYEKRHNLYCCCSCAASQNNIGVRRNWKPKLSKKCCGCNNFTTSAKFCSSKCCSDLKQQTAYKKIEAGTYKNKNQKVLREYLVAHRGHKCESCNNSTWLDKPITLHAHHKDGNSTNNKLDNVMLLCPNCHSTTDTYGSKNNGNGRHYRMARYKLGLSY
jgi:hypothetical protein